MLFLFCHDPFLVKYISIKEYLLSCATVKDRDNITVYRETLSTSNYFPYPGFGDIVCIGLSLFVLLCMMCSFLIWYV